MLMCTRWGELGE